jgi:hypothetical protein
MANLRIAYAASQFANLDWNESIERPIDRVAAAGKTSRLEVWKAAYSREPSAIRHLHRTILAVFRERYPRDQHAEPICEQAIHEWLCPQCHTCHGARQVTDPGNENTTVPCGDCHGSGKQRHSDEARSRRMQISYAQTKHSAHKIVWLLNWLANNDAEINRVMNVELGRGQTATEH